MTQATIEPTQADKELAEAKSASDKSFMDEMDALTSKYKQAPASPEPEPVETAVVVKPDSDESSTATDSTTIEKADEVQKTDSETTEKETIPSASEEEPKKGTAEFRIKELAAKVKERDREVTELKEKVKQPASPIQLMPDPVPDFKLSILKPEQAENFTNAQLFLWHNQAKEVGNEALAEQYLNAISEKEQYEKHKTKVKDYNDRLKLVQDRRNESIQRTRKDYPDMYNETSKMFTEFRNLQADPDFGEIINLIGVHPNAPYAIARVVNNIMRVKYGTSSDALDKKVKELESELASARKGKFPPRSGTASGTAPAPGVNGTLTPSQQLDADFDALIAKRGRKI